MATARRTNGWRFLIADPEDMKHLMAIYLDDELVIWHESGELVFGTLFKLHETLYYSDDKKTSVSRRAVFLHDYMKRKHRKLADGPQPNPRSMQEGRPSRRQAASRISPMLSSRYCWNSHSIAATQR